MNYRRQMQPLAGSKGGEPGKQRQPVEAPDSLASIAYARILDIIGEGEIVGLVDGLKSVYLDETPMMSVDGTLNFQGAKIWTRTGSQDQDYIPGFPAVESEVGVGVELRSDQPYTRSINNSQLSAVSIRLSVRGFKQQNPSNGDTTGYYVAYAIDLSTAGGPYVQVLSSAFNGKTGAKYERQHRINLPPSSANWALRVRRLTPNSSSSLIQDGTYIESVTETIDGKFRYPNTALVGCQFDSSQFSSIPSRAFKIRGRVISVPSNYDAESRSYSGVWDGTFKPSYTNNPAWIYYDLLLHKRYGLGNRVNPGQVNRYELYNIGRYCDEMVDDGFGGLEPRFTCNVYLQARKDALRVLQDLATVFRGITYWGGSIAQASADMPSDPVYTYTNANVLGGKFAYKSSPKSTRYSTALVSWNDPKDFYRAKAAYHEDPDLIDLFGIQQVELTAFGCTSEGQANRAAKWALITNKLETDTVSFNVGIEGAVARPGQVIRVADNARAGRRIGGRIRSASAAGVVVDALGEIRPGDKLTIITPAGVAETRTIREGFCGIGVEGGQMAGSTNYYAGSMTDFIGEFNITGCVITVTEPFSSAPVPESVWAFENDELIAQRFRVTAISESNAMEYTITAAKYVEGKYAFIDNGTMIQQPPISVIPPSVQPSPANILVTSDYLLDQGQAVTKMTVTWDQTDHAVAYEVQWRRDNGDWVFAGRTGTTEVDVVGIYAGRYIARVMAFNPLGIGSVWAYSLETALEGKTTPPPAVTGLRTTSKIFGIDIDWGFPALAEDTNYTEVQYNTAPDEGAGLLKLGDYSYPTDNARQVGLGPGVRFYFRARLVDKTGNVGPWTAWVVGISSADASPILDTITGQITETMLGQELLEKIEMGGDAGAAIEIVQQTVNDLEAGLSAGYSIKLGVQQDGTYYAAGMGIGIENTPEGMQSQVVFLADRFSVMSNINGTPKALFSISGGVAYMDTAFIQNGTIDMLKIGSNLQSSNYVPNVSGWAFLPNGDFQMMGNHPGGNRLMINNNGVFVFYPNGVKAIDLSVDVS